MKFNERVMSTLEAALRKGCKMHAFSSGGGGLQVIRIEKNEKLVAYGEHPNVSEAFRITADDFKAGGRPYNRVYGKIETHYPTGSSMPEDELDAWLRQGSTFDAYASGENVVFELHGLEDYKVPDEIVKAVIAGQTLTWTTERGVVLESSSTRFANGSQGCSTRIVTLPDGMKHHRAWMWRVCRRGTASQLIVAIPAAFTAKVEEIDDQ